MSNCLEVPLWACLPREDYPLIPEECADRANAIPLCDILCNFLQHRLRSDIFRRGFSRAWDIELTVELKKS